MSRFAGTGSVRGNREYPFNTMNDIVYPVHGGMEDWGYAVGLHYTASRSITTRLPSCPLDHPLAFALYMAGTLPAGIQGG